MAESPPGIWCDLKSKKIKNISLKERLVAAFYYDIVCPYAYMAFMRLNRENIFVKKNIALKPILLGGLFKLMGQESNLNSTLPKYRADYIRKDIMRQAQRWSVPLVFHDRHPVSSLKAMRLLHACEPHVREKLSVLLYQAYWQEQRDIDDDNFISDLSRDFCCAPLEDAKMPLITATAEAFSERVFGVPTLAINNRLYFGSDRLELIQEELELSKPEQAWTPGANLDFYFDFTSPYSYLAYLEVEKALEVGVNINFKPVLLGALFKNQGQQGVPMFKAHAHKAAYYLQDMQDWAQARNADFIFNSNFPLKTVNALRVALIEPKTIGPIFRAAWAENANIGDDHVLENILSDAGFLAQGILAETKAEIIKEKLKDETFKAFSRGVFGVPFFGFKNQLVFGQDRFGWLKYELAQK